MPSKNFALTNRVALHVNARIYSGWLDIRVRRSIETAAADFAVSGTERRAGQLRPVRIFPGDECRVRIGEDLVITGHVEDVAQGYDARQRTLTISGRSRTADLVDCSASEVPGQFFHFPNEQIADRLAEPYCIAVRAEVDTGPRIPQFQVQPGETVHAAIERLARTHALIVTDDEKGALVLTRAGVGRAAGRIKLGENILAANGNLSHRQRFSHYVVKGQRDGDDAAEDVGAFSAVEGQALDRGVRRYRRLLLVGDSPGGRFEQRQRAQWEASTRAGHALKVSYTLQGWRDPKGALWRPNALVKVEDPWLGIERDLLIVSVAFTLSDTGGSTTELELAPKEAYELLPEVTAAAGAGYATEKPAETEPKPFRKDPLWMLKPSAGR